MDTHFEAIVGERVQGDLSAVTVADTADPFDPIVGRSDVVRAVMALNLFFSSGKLLNDNEFLSWMVRNAHPTATAP